MRSLFTSLIFVFQFGSGMIFSQSVQGHEAGGAKSFITITTPYGEAVRLRFVEREEWKSFATHEAGKDISSPEYDGQGKKTILLPDGSVAYRQYVDGPGILFFSLSEFVNCMDVSKYLGPHFKFNADHQTLRYYEFRVKPKAVEELGLTHGVHRPEFDSKFEMAIQLPSTAFFYADMPHRNSGIWCADPQNFEAFLADYHDNTEFVQLPNVSKLVWFQGAVVAVRRLNKGAAGQLTNQLTIASDLEWGDDAFRLEDQRVMVKYMGLFVLFDNDHQFAEVKAAFRNSHQHDEFFGDEANIPQFHDYRSSAASVLGEVLGLENLGYSYQDLDRLGARVNDFLITPNLLDRILVPTIVYLGEVYNHESGKDRWLISKNAGESETSWEPMIRAMKSDIPVSLYERVLQTLLEQENSYRSCLECILYGLDI